MPVVPISPDTGVPDGWAPDVSCCQTKWDTYDPSVQARAANSAAFMLYTLTGRQYGTVQRTVRPCNAARLPPLYQTFPVNWLNPFGIDEDWSGGWGPYIWNGVWHNVGGCGWFCCSHGCEVVLDGPVVSVEQVTIDGATVDPATYRVDGGFLLVRQDTDDCWPRCQDYSHKPTETNTFQVVYTQGVPVPLAVQAAAGSLACELAAACVNAACRLPWRMQNLTRQGVSVQFVQVTEYLDRGLTGLPEVDMIVAQVNPHRNTQRPRVSSLDLSPTRETTWPSP